MATDVVLRTPRVTAAQAAGTADGHEVARVASPALASSRAGRARCGGDAPRVLRATALGLGAARALRGGAEGAVVLAFGPGGYLLLGDRHVLLAPVRSPLGPLSVLVAGLAAGHLVPGDRVRVTDDALELASLRIVLAGARPAPAPRATPLSADWRPALAAALRVVAPVPADLIAGLDALARGDVGGGLSRLAGLGEGLTPAGDDVLAGYMAWRWSQGTRLTLPAHNCAPLGRDYLRCAERGELPAPAARVLQAIRDGEPQAAERAARGLGAWGASSGRALLWGIAAGARCDHA
ncbi:MAG TPA: DUF2877 domain-containing protein [Solirubrobacteraceae bacterium]|nr:DUF2877 domain-containing protein [Solirubrobacteraceae bacterium]